MSTAAPLQSLAVENPSAADPAHSGALRAKPRIGVGGAAFEEQEADRVADRLAVATAQPGGADAPAGADALSLTGPQRLAGLGAGRALTRGERAWAEPRFGRSFGDLRIHPAHLPRRPGIPLGWAYGRHIGVPDNALASPGGRHVLAHELAHVVQRSGRAPIFQAYGGEEATASAAYWPELVIASVLHPYFPISTAAVYDYDHPLLGYLAMWGEALAGDFVDDPTFGAILIRTLLTLIPGVDTVADVEDMAAAFYQLVYLQRYNEAMPWASFVISIIGFFPELGSIFEGIIRGILMKGGHAVVSLGSPVVGLLATHLDELAPFVRAHGHEMFEGMSEQALRIRAAVAAFEPGERLSALVPNLSLYTSDALKRIDGEILTPLKAARQQLDTRIDDAMMQVRAGLTPKPAATPAGLLPTPARVSDAPKARLTSAPPTEPPLSVPGSGGPGKPPVRGVTAGLDEQGKIDLDWHPVPNTPDVVKRPGAARTADAPAPRTGSDPVSPRTPDGLSPDTEARLQALLDEARRLGMEPDAANLRRLAKEDPEGFARTVASVEDSFPAAAREAADRADRAANDVGEHVADEVGDVQERLHRAGATGEPLSVNPTPGGKQQRAATEAGNLVHGKRNAEALREELGDAPVPAQFAADVAAGDIVTLDALPDHLLAEVPLGVTARVDRLEDAAEGIIYDLKPNTVDSINGGFDQLKRYVDLANAQHVGGRTDWRGVIVVYDAAKAKAYIPR